MKKVRLGIVGLGAQGNIYAEFLVQGKVNNMVIGAICDTNPKKKALVDEKYPNVPFYEDYIEMLESGDVDAVITCTTHYKHTEMGNEALYRKNQGLIKKPTR